MGQSVKAIIGTRTGRTRLRDLSRLTSPLRAKGRVGARARGGPRPGRMDLMTGRRTRCAPRDRNPRPKNLRLGYDAAGRVEAVGAGVTEFGPGQEVFGTSRGSFAEYAVARPDRLLPKLDNVSFEQAAAVPISGFRYCRRSATEASAPASGVDHRCGRRRRYLRSADGEGGTGPR